MNPITTVLVLLVAALLEAGGDALVRSGLHASTAVVRTLFFLIGSVVLFGYGYTVNVVPWDFGRLLGLYVVFFFVIAQIISWVVFHQRPSPAVLLGGVFIVIGGVIISFASSAQ
jgi:small multidrug resistance family-3 protein